MVNKNIEASREARLWLTQVIVPAFCVAMIFPKSRKFVLTTAQEVGDKIKNVLHK